MKIRNYMLIGLLPLCFTACQTDEIPVPPEGNGNTEQTPEEPGESEDDSDKPINEELLLGLDATLKNLVESRSGVINAWQTGNEIGLYTEEKNLKYTYNGSKWIAAEPYRRISGKRQRIIKQPDSRNRTPPPESFVRRAQ